MSERYTKKWMVVQGIISRAQQEMVQVVEEMCRMLLEDLGPVLSELQRQLNFTYVIKPRLGDGDIMSCVPCLYIDAPAETALAVERELSRRCPDVVSDSRLAFERLPPRLVI